MLIDPVFSVTAQYFLAALFWVSSVHKIRHWKSFKGVMTSYQLIPQSLVTLSAFCITSCELLLAIVLTAQPTNFGAGILSAGLLVLYFAAMAINITRGRIELHCGCTFLNREAPLSQWHLLRNSLLIGFSLILCMPQQIRLLNGLELIQVGSTILCLGILYLAVDVLLANRIYLVKEEA